MNRNEKDALRSQFLDEVKSRLIGPQEAEEELYDAPHKRYLTGMLFPKGAIAGAATADEETSGEDAGIDDSDADLESPMDMLFQKLPASIGITFALTEKEHSVVVSVAAARYLRQVGSVVASETGSASKMLPKVWKRYPLQEDDADEVVEFSEPFEGTVKKTVLSGQASIHFYVRRSRGVRIATVSLVHEKETPEDSPADPEEILFQVRLTCEPSNGIPAYPETDFTFEDLEAAELALQYRSMPVFAVGHGCGVSWAEPQDGYVADVSVDFMPSVEVPPVTTEISSLTPVVAESLSLVRLQDIRYDPVPSFRSFVSLYEDWHVHLESEKIPERFSAQRERILHRIGNVVARMRDGIDLLEHDRAAMHVFRLANRAMLVSIARTMAIRKRQQSEQYIEVSLQDLDPDMFRWRPFQLAFILLSLRGLWEPQHEDRNIVDLIWFPTGGGKTEAYLAVAAFEMLRRRIQDGARGEGTAVIKRYTLRLLTIQQFERAGSLICALETMRRNGDVPGGSPISLGLWVGSDSSPNDYRTAHDDLKKINATIGKVDGVKVPLKQCPVCGTPIVPDRKEEGDSRVGLRAARNRIEIFCPNPVCPFHDFLPISYIDQHLYEFAPTMLLGTVDKFAMLAWRDEARSFFGTDSGTAPPSLIIQDELHLISGPLGTLAGVYEAAIDTVIESLGYPAKYICATATIRRADDQIRKLYGRRAALFPPPGLDAADSFYSRQESGKAGRLYVGAMGQGHTPTFSNVIVSAALLAAGGIMRERIGEVADPWWTVVAYHNSKRELGKTLSLARDDIPARLQALGEQRGMMGAAVNELSSNLKDSEIPESLHRLAISIPDPSALDFVACTSMLSVGVDVPRLGLMLVNGQPKTVSEYIQASSRVGRDEDRLPGLVLTLFSPTKPRDRSHYEFFRPFHKGYYRYVEPTSVTPFAPPAQDRGIHGAFLVLVRMVSELHANNHASLVNKREEDIIRLRDRYLERVARAKDGNIDESRRRLDNFMEFWKEQANLRGNNLRFQSGGKQHAGLVRPFRAPGDGWETLQSLRHVDTPLKLFVPVITRGEHET